MLYCLRHLCIVLFLFALNYYVVGQSAGFFSNRFQDEKRSVYLNYNHSFTATTLPSQFVFSYINGDFISEESKEKAISALGSENSGIYDFSMESGLRYRLKSEGLFLVVGISYNIFTEFEFSKDLFELYFKGNRGFEGKTAELGPFSISNIQYGKAKLGLERNWSKGYISIYAGALSGSTFFEYHLNKGTLYTAEFGKKIELNLNMEGYDLEKNLLFTGKSLGYCLGASFRYEPISRLNIYADIQNLGDVVWSGGVRNRIVDTLYNYSGFEISNILDSFAINLKSTQDIENDFIENRFIDSKKQKLPYVWSVGLDWDIIRNKLRLGSLIRNIVAKETYPLYQLSLKYFLNSNLGFGVQYSKRYNGAGGLGISAGTILFDKFSIEAEAGTVESFTQQSKPLQLHAGMNLRLKL